MRRYATICDDMRAVCGGNSGEGCCVITIHDRLKSFFIRNVRTGLPRFSRPVSLSRSMDFVRFLLLFYFVVFFLRIGP